MPAQIIQSTFTNQPPDFYEAFGQSFERSLYRSQDRALARERLGLEKERLDLAKETSSLRNKMTAWNFMQAKAEAERLELDRTLNEIKAMYDIGDVTSEDWSFDQKEATDHFYRQLREEGQDATEAKKWANILANQTEQQAVGLSQSYRLNEARIKQAKRGKSSAVESMYEYFKENPSIGARAMTLEAGIPMYKTDLETGKQVINPAYQEVYNKNFNLLQGDEGTSAFREAVTGDKDKPGEDEINPVTDPVEFSKSLESVMEEPKPKPETDDKDVVETWERSKGTTLFQTWKDLSETHDKMRVIRNQYLTNIDTAKSQGKVETVKKLKRELTNLERNIEEVKGKMESAKEGFDKSNFTFRASNPLEEIQSVLPWNRDRPERVFEASDIVPRPINPVPFPEDRFSTPSRYEEVLQNIQAGGEVPVTQDELFNANTRPRTRFEEAILQQIGR